jgi:hypothetical protein
MKRLSMARPHRRRSARKALIARRNFIGWAGGLAAAWALRRPASAQVYSQTTISQAAQNARREVGRLGQSADSLLRHVVEAGPEHGAEAVQRFRTRQRPLARALGGVLNKQVSEDDWLLIVPTRELDLALAMQPLAIRIVPTADEVEAMLQEPLPQVEPLPGDKAADALHMIVLASLGLERRVALFEQMRNDPLLADALDDAAEAVKAERYGLAALELERVMRAATAPPVVAAVVDNLGPGARYRLYKSVTSRFVPFIGWTYFTAFLLAAVYLNRDTTAPVLR